MFKKNKNGSHVGMIASFAIFIFFLIGMYLILSPSLKTQKDKELLLDSIGMNLKNYFSSNLTKIILSNCSNCTIINTNGLGTPPTNNYIGKDEDGNVLGNSFDSIFLRLSIGTNGKKVIWIYTSEISFTTKSSSCPGTPQNNPTIESIRTEKQIFEKKIINGINNFVNLKGNISIPIGSDFSFRFEMNNKTQISAGERNISTEIYVKEFPIQYIDANASTLSGKIIVKVW